MRKINKLSAVLLSAAMLSASAFSVSAAADVPMANTVSELNGSYYYQYIWNENDGRELVYYYNYAAAIVSDYKQCYSGDSIGRLDNALADAETALDNPELVSGYTQEQIDSFASAVKNALEELKPAEDVSNITSYDEAKNIYEFTVNYFEENYNDEENKLTYFSLSEVKDFDGFNFVRVYPGYFSVAMVNVLHIRGYSFEIGSVYDLELSELAIDADTGETLALEDSLRKNKVDIDGLFEYYKENAGKFDFKMFINGDSDFDNRLTVRDATRIQKNIAGLAEHDLSKSLSDLVYDSNGDGRINITDATQVQKKIAQLPVDDDFEYERDVPPDLPSNIKHLDGETENKIKEDYINNVESGLSKSSIEILYYGTLSDGSMLVYPDVYGRGYFTVIVEERIGKYIYSMPCSGRDVKIYRDGKFYSIKNAYESGVISDSVLDEAAEILEFALN